MKRRDFSKMMAGSAALTWGAMVRPALAQTGKPIAGTHYVIVQPRAPVEAPAGKIEVVEFFWYDCPHCNAFEPVLQAWAQKLPADVVLRRVPRRFADSEVPQQQLYYALDAMGLVEKLHAKVFTAIHNERRSLRSRDQIAAWVASQGVDRAKFLEYYNSMSVQLQATRAYSLQEAYKLDGVPALGVAGRFLTDVPMAQGQERALMVVDSLLEDLRRSIT